MERNHLHLTEETEDRAVFLRPPLASTHILSCPYPAQSLFTTRSVASTPQEKVCGNLEKSRICSSPTCSHQSCPDKSVSSGDSEPVQTGQLHWAWSHSSRGSLVLLTPDSSLPVTRVVSKARSLEGDHLSFFSHLPRECTEADTCRSQ